MTLTLIPIKPDRKSPSGVGLKTAREIENVSDRIVNYAVSSTTVFSPEEREVALLAAINKLLERVDGSN